MELSNCAKIFKALSNEQRLEIFMMIYKQCCPAKMPSNNSVILKNEKPGCLVSGFLEKAFTKVCDCMKLSRSTISHHFKELQNAGLITCERQGQTFTCRVNEETVNMIKNLL